MLIDKPKRTFKSEFKRQIRLAIAAAAGFLIAFAWREAIFNAFQNQTQDLPNNIMNGLTSQLDIANLPIRKIFT